MPRIEKNITLDLTDIPARRHKIAKQTVANFLENETLILLEQGKTPVKGEKFKKLNKDYADKFKGGRRTPTLQLEGELLDAFSVVNSRDGVRMQVADSQGDKADGHNQLSSKAKAWAKDTKFPKRRFIPGETQRLKLKIEKEIDVILDEFRLETPPTSFTPSGTPVTEPELTQPTISVTVSDLFDKESIAEALARELRGR